MRRFTILALSTFIPTLAATASHAADPTPAPAATAPAPKPWKGFKIATDDGAFSLKLGTHLQTDLVFFPGDDAKAYGDQVRVRRFRPGLKATVFEHYDTRWLIELAGSSLTVLDAVIETTHLDELRLRIGKDKAPESYDHLQSSTATTFLELGTTAQLSGNRDLGVQLVGNIEKGLVDYQLGLFDGAADAASIDADSDDHFELAGRVTAKPLKPLGVDALADLSLGLTFSYGEAKGTQAAPSVAAYKTTGGASWFKYASGSDLASTVVADGTRFRIGGHLDYRFGPLTVFGEVLSSKQELRLKDATKEVGNLAWQAYAAFLLTGDKADRAGVSPKAPFDVDNGGAGAFELAVRWGELTIDDAAFEGGFADAAKAARDVKSFTVGLNWYLNSAVKLQLNYERSAFDGGASGDKDRPVENFVGARVQFNL